VTSRSRLLLAFIAMALVAGVLGGPGVALAAGKGSGGWYWPTGTENFGGMSGYWVYRSNNHSWHMAQDMRLSQGRPVYAIADGTVAESQANAGYGGVLVIWHKTGDGQKFLAVYGHIIRKNIAKGATVKAGQIIGTTNSSNHVHFGIHPGSAYPPDRNPYRGHTYDSKQTYGWVDPVKFLRQHPASVQPYKAPALPLTATVSTSATPTVLGTADGSVYWSQPSDDTSPTIFAKPLPSGETTRLAEETAPPALDTTRYLVTTATASFSLYDRLPSLTATYSVLEPGWARPIAITGSLKSAAGKPFSGAKVCLERAIGSGPFVAVASGLTAFDGSYAINFAPSRSCTLRVRFSSPSTFTNATTPKVKVAPKPGVHAPDSAKQAKGSHRVLLSGALDARHVAGSRTVTLQVQMLGAAGWSDVATTTATNANAGKSASRYGLKLTLAAGRYRVKASCTADSLHAAEQTGWVTFRAK
jgi:murein DD-endopeptidase MepM/ murein hydrolase activator NlpD